MRVINSRSPNQALHEGLYHLKFHGLVQDSRNGAVVVSPAPVVTIHHDPTARVMGGNMRDANPFFHLFEALWMLSGRNDVEFPAKFAKQITAYSDDGITLHGAYGHRWRSYFGYDQLEVIVDELIKNPTSRRCVLQMWGPGDGISGDSYGAGDLLVAVAGGKDVPCNTACYFDTLDGRLNMTITCRSNDILWGAYGANIVHFSVLQEYVALRTGLPIGVMRQWSNNYHLYTGIVDQGNMLSYADSVRSDDLYQRPGLGIRGDMLPLEKPLRRVPLFAEPVEHLHWHTDLENFMALVYDNGGHGVQWITAFFGCVVGPMFNAWQAWKRKDWEAAISAAETIKADDWRLEVSRWLYKRKEKFS